MVVVVVVVIALLRGHLLRASVLMSENHLHHQLAEFARPNTMEHSKGRHSFEQTKLSR